LRPAHSSSQPDRSCVARHPNFPVAAFVAQVIGQFEPNPVDARHAAKRYEAADALVPQEGTLVAKKL
jgi:hypothetical protein